MKKTLIKIASIVTAFLIVVVLFAIVLLKPNTDTLAAENKKITVNKSTAVSVYVTGVGVELESSSSFQDVYSYESGTSFTLTAVNEKKIFTGWEVYEEKVYEEEVYEETDTAKQTNLASETGEASRKITLSSDHNIIVSYTSRNSITEDYGKFTGNRYSIKDGSDIVALQEIINRGPNPTDRANLEDLYQIFYPDLDLDAALVYYENLRTGYFVVNNNISLFKEETFNEETDETTDDFTIQFTGIGTSTYPFEGVFTGPSETESSQIVSVINVASATNITEFGLFGAIGSNAVIRNIDANTSIGISSATSIVKAGCIAGTMDNYSLNNQESYSPTLVNVNSSGSINITSTNDVYSGILAGYIDEVGIDSITNIGSIKEDSAIMVNTLGNNYAGYIAGKAVDMYVKKLNLDVSGLSIILRNKDSSSDAYAGVLFGEYQNVKDVRFENIKVEANKAFRIEGYVDYATSGYSNSYTGGIAGRMTAGAIVTLGSISLINTDSNASVIRSNTMDASSKGNCFAGGLFGVVSSTNVTGDDNFKYRITEEDVDGKVSYKYNPVFTGNIDIECIQNGEADGSTYGKAVSGGLVGKGIININGTKTKLTDLVLTKEGEFNVSATQTRIAYHKDCSGKEVNGPSDFEHCVSGGVFGLYVNGYNNYTYEYINVYADSLNSKVEREIASLASGHLLNGGFIAYSNGQSLKNINLYYNDCNFISNSLSYETKNIGTDSETDNSHLGGVVGYLYSSSDNVVEINVVEMSNVTLQGIDWTDKSKVIGTNSIISGIQNTRPGKDLHGENYVGGIIGKVFKANVSNVSYIGHSSNTDYIRMSGHEDPDSAFCGGIIGYINVFDTTDSEFNFSNCKFENGNIIADATMETPTFPDIYVGGFAGGCYTRGTSTEIKFNNIKVLKSEIKATGNENVYSFCAGILGGATWASNNIYFNNCYVADSSIISLVNNPGSNAKAVAAGIIGYCQNINVYLHNNAVINSLIKADSGTTSEYVGGLIGNHYATNENNYIKECSNNYSNAVIDCSTTAGKYGLSSGSGYTNNYYHSENANSTGGIGTAVSFADRVVTGSDNAVSNINRSTSYLKYMLVSGEAYQAETNDSYNVVSLSDTYNNTAVSDDLHLWINFKGQGTTIELDTSKSKEALYEEGWFDMGSFMIYNIAYNGTTNQIDSINNSYIYGSDEYIDVEKTGSDIKFETITFPKKEYADIGYTKNSSTSYDIKVYDNIPSLVLKIKVSNSNTKLYERFFTVDANDNETQIDASTGVIGSYGTYTVNKTDDIYELMFTPNVSITSDSEVRIKFLLGYSDSSEIYDTTTITLNLKSNKLNLVGVKYAEYTPAVNDYSYPQTDTLLAGQYRTDVNNNEITYILPASSVVKFVPIVTKSNDINELYGKLYDDERYIEKITYTGGPKSSGELVTEATGSGEITLKLKEGTQNSVSCKYSISTKYDVTYSVIGMTPEAIPYATSGVIYEFKCYVNNGYSGTPRVLTIDGTSYTDLNNLEPNASVKIFNQDGAQLCDGGASWSDENTYYLIQIQIDNISSAIEIVIEFPLIYTVTFNLQCSDFNPNVTEEVKSYKLEEGDSFSEFFNSKNDEIDNWVVNNTLFGYVFTGFYLVDEANNVYSYGLSYEDILKMTDYTMSTSFTFYARWSFLIELVEAPGTTISSSFGEDFMVELDPKDYPEIAKAIMVPLNNKEGYVFTVEKDEYYIGEAYVEAYIITEDAEGHQIVTSIAVEKYHENMYLYHIPTEKIQGFLMIVTSISNSGFIVGENTASVTEEMLPEDGIYTYKYVVNHLYNSEEQSYIYNSGNVNAPLSNLDLTKDFILHFSKQGFDNVNLVTTQENRYLDQGTIIEVYYHKYINGNLIKSIVATKEIKNTTTDKLFLSEFTLLDKQTPAFETETFREFLGGNEAVSEVYYVVITPPNGLHNLENEIINYVVDGGYYSEYSYERKLALAEYSDNLQGIVYPETDGQGNIWRQIITKDIYEKLSDELKEEFRKIFIDYDGDGSVEEVYYHGITDDEYKIAANHKFDTINGYRMIITEILYNLLSVDTLKAGFTAISYDYDGDGTDDNCYYKDVTEYDKIVCDSCKLERITDAYGNAYIQLITQAQYDAITDSSIKSKFAYSPFIKGIRSGKHFVNSPIESGHQAHFAKVESSKQTRVYSVTPSRITEIVNNKFTDDKTYEIFELLPDTGGIVTVTSDSKISLTSTTGNNIIASNTLPFNIAQLYVSLGYGTGDVQILGGINGADFKVLKTINLTTIEYTEYTISFISTQTTDKYNCFKIVSDSANEVRISSLSVVSLNNGMKYTLDQFILNNNKVSFTNEIVNDARHSGKTFMLEVQLYKVENGNKVICENIPVDEVKLIVGTSEYLPTIDSSIHGKVSAYFNLSAILNALQTQDSSCVSFEYTLVYPDAYLLQTELLEVENANKPAMSEVRKTYNNVSFNIADQGYDNLSNVSSAVIGEVTLTIVKGDGENDPRYFESNQALHIYTNNQLKFKANNGYSVDRIVITCYDAIESPKNFTTSNCNLSADGAKIILDAIDGSSEITLGISPSSSIQVLSIDILYN